MMTLETRVEISVLHTVRACRYAPSRASFHGSRETVRRYIRSPLPVADMRYKPRAPRPCKLDPFKTYILERVAAARPQWIPASVLLREIRQRGYEGGYSMLTAFLHPMKQPVTEESRASRPSLAFRCRLISPSSGSVITHCWPFRRHAGLEPRNFRQVLQQPGLRCLVTALSLHSGLRRDAASAAVRQTPRPSSLSAMSTAPQASLNPQFDARCREVCLYPQGLPPLSRQDQGQG
ncbi:Transposase and inactivated derivatives [Serratia odorifera]|uniref:Transposase and inactivated derivatives n=1 Tax=Serratia odorifera TaxID=618 RepID=A0A447KT99_SEROD|nr:Transposase and inactivated derivatives [Serratia odorifera]